MSADPALGLELRRLRVEAGLTQEALAERAGISVRAISDAERGLRTRLYRDTTSRLADALFLTGPRRTRFESLARGAVPATVSGRRAPLPLTPTSLVGREEVLASLVRLLADPATRMLTLTGTGGVGKTRLAVAAAQECTPLFHDGVMFVQLASCHDAASAGLAIATAVGANPAEGELRDMVRAAIGPRRLLLLCDTVEAAPGAASLLAQLLADCAELTVLATSRVALRLTLEHVIPVEPLDPLTARRLFIARATAVRPDMDVVATAYDIDRICERVQRVPLAIELAAARVAHMGLADLHNRLAHQLATLTGGPVDTTERHRAMESTIAWSYALLDNAAQATLASCSVFDGWTLEAAEHLLATDPLPSLSRLVDHNLTTAPRPDQPHGRYEMLDVVREFGTARLAEAGAEEETRDSHAEWYLGRAELASGAMRMSGQKSAHRETAADLGNMRIAFRRFCETGRTADALRLASALWMFWLWQGGFSEGRAWLRTTLADAPELDPSLVARAHWAAGWLAYHQGDFTESRMHAAALTRLVPTHGDATAHRNALTLQGMVALADRDVDAGARLLEQALTLALTLSSTEDAPWLLAVSTLNHGVGRLLVGHMEEAARRFQEARARFGELGDTTYEARALRHLAAAKLMSGELERAGHDLDESLDMVRDAEDEWGRAETLNGLALLASASGNQTKARDLARSATDLRRALGVALHPFDAILTDRYLGHPE